MFCGCLVNTVVDKSLERFIQKIQPTSALDFFFWLRVNYIGGFLGVFTRVATYSQISSIYTGACGCVVKQHV